MKYIDFFPSYPSIDNPNFYQHLYEKKEFYDLAEKGSQKSFLNHQLIPARFLSPWTFYQSLLLIHDTGTGKSGCAAATLNILKNYNEDITMLYITNNDTLVRNFKNELLKLCPWIKKNKKKWENDNTFFRKNRMFFSTFGSFERDFEKISKIKLNRVFIILDEVHHLITKTMSNYEKIVKYLKLIPNRKLMALTATPMRDDSLELIYLLNLVLPIPLPTGRDFINEYLDYKKINDLEQYVWKPHKDIEFRRKIAGYISIYRQKIDNLNINYIGEYLLDLKFTKVYLDKMDKFQNDIYIESWGKKEESDDYDSLYNHSIQSSLMVFPNGSYGSLGSNEYTIRNKQYSLKFFKETELIQNPSSRNEYKRNLEIIKKYSIVYYDIIKSILNAKEQKKSVYIYSEKINGSGILRMVYLLQQCFRYSIVSENASENSIFKEKKERIIFLGEEEVMKYIQIFNHRENRYGEYVRVIIGTDRTTEGITLKNIQEIHITTPGWNFGKKNQAEGRGIRYGSHSDLEEKEIDINIYLHCAVPKNPNYSVNYLQYKRSEIKEKNIYLFSYAMLISAMDCQLNYYQNYQSNKEDYSAQCYFQKCEYQCDGITNINIGENDIYNGNFNTYYLDTNKKIIEEIQKLYFYNEYPKTFQEIKNKLSHQKFSEFQIYYTILQIIETPILVRLKDGTLKYIIEENGYIYLSSNRDILNWSNKQPLYELEYQKPVFSIENNVSDIKENMVRREDILLEKLNQFNLFIDLENLKLIYDFFHSFPEFLQEIMIEEYPTLSILKDGVYEENSNSIKIKKKGQENNLEIKDERIKELEDNPYGLYAFPNKDSFKIRDVREKEKAKDKRTTTKGQDVKTIEVSKLVLYILRFRHELDQEIRDYAKKEFHIENIEEEYSILEEKYPLLKEQKYNKKEKELILFLLEMFSNKRRILIQIIHKEILKYNVMLL